MQPLITDTTAQKRLEYKIALHKTLHECIESLFTTTATNTVARDAYTDILDKLKQYYNADGAFFYKFVEGSNEVEAIYRVLAKYNILPRQIKLEVTERSIIADMDLMSRKMASMMEKGVDFELDDFGTDYSNLEMCISLPLEIIKLERSLLLAASVTDTGRQFFGHILYGLHASGRLTIMEGVETKEQLDWATNCNCDYIQRYYFSKPVDFDGFSNILKVE